MVTVLSMLAFGTAFGLGTTFSVRFVARRIGLVDRPDGRRKFQSQPVALAGGVAVLVSAFATLVAAALARPEIAESMDENFEKVLALGVAAIAIVIVGLIDDAVNLRARYKLAGQLGAAFVLVFGGGFAIEEVSAFGTVIPLGSAAVPVAVFWFVGAMNAFNLLDGMDGLLGTLALIIVGSLAGMAFAGGNPFVGWVAVALAGGLVGFLRFNLPPATIYLGDAGSMLVGLCFAALAIGACQKGPAVAIVAPTVLLVLPILDTTAAIVRRKLAGRALAASDLGHLHHVLQRAGMTRGRVLALVAALGIVAASGALGGTLLQNDLLAALSAAAVATILVTTGWFGTTEIRLVRERVRAMMRAAFGRPVHGDLESVPQVVWGTFLTCPVAENTYQGHVKNVPHEPFGTDS